MTISIKSQLQYCLTSVVEEESHLSSSSRIPVRYVKSVQGTRCGVFYHSKIHWVAAFMKHWAVVVNIVYPYKHLGQNKRINKSKNNMQVSIIYDANEGFSFRG